MRRRASDRRGGLRFEIVGQLWGWLSVSEPLHVQNISRGGVLVEAKRPLLPDSQHDVRLLFERQVSSLQVRVCHVTPMGGDGNAGTPQRYLVGFEFVGLEPLALDQIDRIVAAGGIGL